MNETKQPTPRAKRQLRLPDDPTQEDMGRLPKEWSGSNRYNRVGRIGKGAFATVYKVTAKFDGKPYAAKELDKRKFMKNGVLDQKVENEMRIMQKVKHVSLFAPHHPDQHTGTNSCSRISSSTLSTLTGVIGL